jgi:phenylalanyl-tRNA synthetase alpha chain
MHEKGGHGSIGYRYDWSIDEAKTNILRTHTTAVSSRMLYKLANQVRYRACSLIFCARTHSLTCHLLELFV